MRATGSVSSWLQLTKLFLRQFLENDLVSPDADRAQLLAIVGAGVVSLTLFISMFLSAGYAMTVLTPGEAAVRTLNDKFFYPVVLSKISGSKDPHIMATVYDRSAHGVEVVKL